MITNISQPTTYLVNRELFDFDGAFERDKVVEM
jgi:hypothetical protein